MAYFGDIAEGLLTAVKGMGITLSRVREKPNTVQWPHEPATTKARTRAELFNNIDDCIGCMNCAKACPVDCIDIETVKSTKTVDLGRTSNGKKKTLHLARFDIDMAKCCYCGLCVEACPTECLVMTEKFDYSAASIQSLQYAFARMSPEEIAAAQVALDEEKRLAAIAAAEAKVKAEAEAKAKAEAEAKAKAEAEAQAAAAPVEPELPQAPEAPAAQDGPASPDAPQADAGAPAPEAPTA